ncbi:hypothetical protein A3Q56_01190 [Intoshia linei]|uniref:Uncharacterized protein n=1 Tax=Intoshia linei TaxID=1819745 RepID=A0A177BC17_9BILA|nr:hypothetical protein A3Q56_01190 [Intoshia linei]
MTGERLSADSECVAGFIEKFNNIIAEKNYSMEQIYNANESPIFYKKSPKFTSAHPLEKSIPGYKSSKDRLLKIIIISWEEWSMDVDDSELMDDSQILYMDNAEPSISEDERQDMLSSVDKLIAYTQKHEMKSDYNNLYTIILIILWNKF